MASKHLRAWSNYETFNEGRKANPEGTLPLAVHDSIPSTRTEEACSPKDARQTIPILWRPYTPLTFSTAVSAAFRVTHNFFLASGTPLASEALGHNPLLHVDEGHIPLVQAGQELAIPAELDLASAEEVGQRKSRAGREAPKQSGSKLFRSRITRRVVCAGWGRGTTHHLLHQKE